MAEHKVQPKTMAIFIDPTGGTNYDDVVCLLSVTKSDAIAEIDAASYCGPDSSPGALTISYGCEAQHLQDPDTGKVSGTSLRILARAKTTLGFKICPIDLEDGDEIETGTCYISALDSNYAFDAVGTFSVTFKPYGTPVISIQGS